MNRKRSSFFAKQRGSFKKAKMDADASPEELTAGPAAEPPTAKYIGSRTNPRNSGNTAPAATHKFPKGTGRVSGSEDSEDDVREQLSAHVPLEVLERLRQDGVGPSGRSALKAAREAALVQYKRHSRHMPAEESAKRPVPRFREVLQVAKREYRDPRFDDGSGELNRDRFMKQYNFLYNEILPGEREDLRKQIKRAKTEEEVAELRVALSRVQNRLLEHKTRQQQQHVEAEVKAKEKAAVKEDGKKRFYTKKSELKKMMLMEKYKELEKAGKLEKFMEKRRKKNAAKDHKRIPRTRISS